MRRPQGITQNKWRRPILDRSAPAEPRPLKAPTLVQVARLAGVGIGTASRVLNNEGYVSQSTAARVRAVIDQIGYKPNEVARNLKVRRSGAVGIVVSGLTDPFVATCIQAAQIVIRNSGNISILTFSGGSPETEALEIDYLIRRQIDGILIIPASGGDSHHLSPNALNGKPLISFDQPIPGRLTDSVLVRNKEGATAGVEHLIFHGHRRIVALGVNKHLHSMQKRVEGYREVMRRNGLIPDVCMLAPSRELIGVQLDQWRAGKNPPTAIFSLNGVTSMFLLNAIAERGICVPAELAVLGFDDFPLAGLLASPLSVVRQPAAQLGAEAATLLLERMSKTPPPPRRITLETELILRRSCGCPAPAQVSHDLITHAADIRAAKVPAARIHAPESADESLLKSSLHLSHSTHPAL